MAPTVSPLLLEQAADWVITLHFAEPTEQDRQAFARWHGASPAHQAAWARAETMRASFDSVASGVGRQALHSLDDRKRATVRVLAALLVAGPAGWLGWRELPWPRWAADVATGKGERRTLTLADGSQLTLNGNSAVDLRWTAGERRLVLHAGELLVTTHADSVQPARPFLVQTPHGTARALGTRFAVRLTADDTRVAVFEHAVALTTALGGQLLLGSGQQASFDRRRVRAPGAADPNARLWASGMLVARNLRLADVVAELDRHRHGFLRCDPAIADLRVSGALPLDDVDASLDTLAQSLPLHINRLHRYWIMVEPKK